MIFIGIDPGKTGGIGWLRGGAALAEKMPETERDVWERLKGDSGDLPIDFAVIERAQPMPKQGVSSAFNYGVGYGGLRATLIALGIPFETVHPGKWQRALGCLSRGDKNVTKRKAQELFPSLKITHATADALLLAYYARMIHAQRTGT